MRFSTRLFSVYLLSNTNLPYRTKSVNFNHRLKCTVIFFGIPAGRRRHAYRKVFPIIVGTYMIMSAVLIPMGFMFMSTLGGKALLISKMALIISLMSNIKKIFSYEYYVPSAPAQPHHHWKRTLQLAHRTTAGPLYSSYTAYWRHIILSGA